MSPTSRFRDTVPEVASALSATANALKASYVVKPDGLVVLSATTGDAHLTAADGPLLHVVDGYLRARSPVLSQALRRALERSYAAGIQFIGPQDLDHIICLRSVLVLDGLYVFVRLPGQDIPSVGEIQGFGELFGLTPAEREVLLLMCQSLNPVEIARRTSVAISTVRSHVRSILKKTGAEDSRCLLIRIFGLMR